MGSKNYGSFEAQNQRQIREKRNEVHPVWRGVGFLLIFLTPIMGYFGAVVLIDKNQQENWISIPSDFLADGADSMLYIKIGLTLILAFLFYFILQFLTFIIIRAVGPSRYGPYDVPPVTYRGKHRSR